MRDGVSVAQKQMCQISGRGLLEACQGAVYYTVVQFINTNGPAVEGVSVTRRQHRHKSVPVGQKAVPVQGGFGTCFCRPGTSLIEHYECRGTKFIADQN